MRKKIALLPVTGLLVLVGGGLDVGKGGDEVAEDFRRDHDRVTVPAHVFGDFDNHAPLVLFQVQKEDFPIRQDFLRMQ